MIELFKNFTFDRNLAIFSLIISVIFYIFPNSKDNPLKEKFLRNSIYNKKQSSNNRYRTLFPIIIFAISFNFFLYYYKDIKLTSENQYNSDNQQNTDNLSKDQLFTKLIYTKYVDKNYNIIKEGNYCVVTLHGDEVTAVSVKYDPKLIDKSKYRLYKSELHSISGFRSPLYLDDGANRLVVVSYKSDAEIDVLFMVEPI